MIWEFGVNFLFTVFTCYDFTKGIIVDTEPQRNDGRENPLNAEDPEKEVEDDSPPTPRSSGGTLPRPATSTDGSTTQCGGMGVLVGVVMPATGLVMALFGLAAIPFHVMPSTLVLTQAVEETSTWAPWAVDKACLQLWKDELEDLPVLWSF